MTNICPHCGYSIEADRVVERDGWRIDPRGGVWKDGRLITRRTSWSNILHALATNGDRVMTTLTLLARISESENPNTLAATISQMRRAFADAGATAPITSIRPGYRWCAT